MKNLSIDTAPVPKKGRLDVVRQDGEAFGIVITIGDFAFKGPRFFGSKQAQQKMVQKIIDNWPERPTLEVEL